MKMRIIAFAALLATAGIAGAAIAQVSSTSVPKDGSCPTGFKASGDMCTSSSGQVAIEKIGSCPRPFRASANYCVGPRGAYAEVRNGSCPSGLQTSGNYCVRR